MYSRYMHWALIFSSWYLTMKTGFHNEYEAKVYTEHSFHLLGRYLPIKTGFCIEYKKCTLYLVVLNISRQLMQPINLKWKIKNSKRSLLEEDFFFEFWDSHMITSDLGRWFSHEVRSMRCNLVANKKHRSLNI